MAKKKIPKPVDAYVGARVRGRRLELRMSQSKLSDAIGLAFQQIQKYEKGSNRIGSSRLMQIANILDVPPGYFFEGAPGAERTVEHKGGSLDYVTDFVTSRDGIALLKAFMKVPKELRWSIVHLVEKIAERE